MYLNTRLFKMAAAESDYPIEHTVTIFQLGDFRFWENRLVELNIKRKEILIGEPESSYEAAKALRKIDEWIGYVENRINTILFNNRP